jgi:hypothetical protein
MNKQTLAALRSAFSKDSEQKNPSSNNYYPFWNMKDGEKCVIRFLPDKNDENPYGFLVEKSVHTLEINGEQKTVPCLTMYGEDCPICKLSQKYYKAKDEINGKKYWRKKQHIAQALIVEDPLPPNDAGETHEGKVRFITLGFQLYEIIQHAFKSDDVLDSIPYDFEEGYDFIIKKSKQGNYSTYAVGSRFARKQRPLTEEQLAVAEADMVDLSTLLPKNPGFEKVNSMLEASLVGANYSDDEDEEEFVPTKPQRQTSKPTTKVVDNKDDEDDEEFQTPKVVSSKKPKNEEPEDEESDDMDVEQILESLRNNRRR